MQCLDDTDQPHGGRLQQLPTISSFGLLPVCRLIHIPVLCAGSRSSALTTAVALHPRARVVPCIDERSLAFWALGFGRAHGSVP